MLYSNHSNRLNWLLNKSDMKGFNLLELVITATIIGVLAGLFIPSYISQIGKARAAEGKTSLGMIMRSQQRYRLEFGTFINDLTQLDISVSSNFLQFQATNASRHGVEITSTSLEDDIHLFQGNAQQTGSDFQYSICRSDSKVPNGTFSGVALSETQCNTNFTLIQ